MPNNKGTRRLLSEEEHVQIRTRYLAGDPAKEIACSLGCSTSAIWSSVRGLTSSRNREEYADALARMASLSVEDRHWIAGIVVGDFLDVLRAEPFDAFFLDGCAVWSPTSVGYLADCMATVPRGSPVAAAFAYGRWSFPGRRPAGVPAAAHWRNWAVVELAKHGAKLEARLAAQYRGRRTPMLVLAGHTGQHRMARLVSVPSHEIEAPPERVSDADRCEETRARKAAYYAANREEIRARTAAYYAANREKILHAKQQANKRATKIDIARR